MSGALAVSGLVAGYGQSTVLHGVGLAVATGSITAIVGGNGAGKTTLMRVLSGLLAPRDGAILLDGRDVTAAPAHQRVARGIALVPEGRLVFPDMTVEETLRLGAYAPRARVERAAAEAEMYALFPRLAERRRQRAGSLSGGEQQMLALARGLMARPRLLLLDEPSLGLSPKMADLVFETVTAVRARGITICLVEQDVHAALRIADRGYVLENGRIAAEGTGRALLDLPDIRSSLLGL